MSTINLDTTPISEIADAARKVAAALDHLPGHKWIFLHLAEHAKKTLVDFEAACAGLKFEPAFFELPICARQAALVGKDCVAIAASADGLRDLQIEAGNMNAAANRLVPSVKWPCERSAYDWESNGFGVLADVVRMRAGL